MKLQRLALVFVAAFGVTLALIVGQRLSAEAMAVLLGVVAGVLASIPTSLIVVWLTRGALANSSRPAAVEFKREPPEREVKVVVVPPAPAVQPASAAWLTHPAGWPPATSVAAPRQFTVIGGEATAEETPAPWL